MSKTSINRTTPDDDFGFSLVDEAELRKYEEELRERLAKEQLTAEQLRKHEEELKQKHQKELEKTLQNVQSTAQQKMEGLKNLFMPLLKNLARDEDKHYIFWPNRVEKINSFIKKIDQYIDDNK